MIGTTFEKTIKRHIWHILLQWFILHNFSTWLQWRKFSEFLWDSTLNLQTYLEVLWLNVVYSKNMKTILAHFKHEKFHVLKEKKYHCNNFLSVMNVTCSKTRSSRPDVFCEKGVLKNFEKFTGKHPC